MGKIKAIIFDMDGILVDSEVSARECMKKCAHKRSLPFEDSFYELFLGCNDEMSFKILNNRYHNEKLVQEMMEEFEELALKEYEDGKIGLKKGCKEIIGYLQERNIPYALATGSSFKFVEMDFLNNGYDEVPFEYVVSGERIKNSKPHPEIFIRAAGLMNINVKDCLIIEDSPKGIEAAFRAGACSCLIPDLATPTEEMIKKSSFRCDDLFGAIDLIENLIIQCANSNFYRDFSHHI